METKTIFFIGKPGCGKGDQVRLLSEKTGWKIIPSPGEDFRSMSAEDTPVGRKIKSVNDAGELQPHWLAEHILMKKFFLLSENESVICEGFGRTVLEAQFIIDLLAWLGRSFLVLHLKVSDEEIKHRIALRKEIEGRMDDNVVDKRLEEYNKNTAPAVEVFREKGVLIEINGEGTREEIAENIRKALNLQ